MKRPDRSEADLARYIVGYFQNLQWEVYQEVQLSTQGSRADIVVTQGKLVGICECKQSLGLPVLEQAYEWKPYAHFVWVATWYKSRTGRLIHRIVEDYGFGHLQHTSYSPECNSTQEKTKPVFLRRPPNLELLTQKLRPEHKSGFAEAGGNTGGHFTPFRETCLNLRKVAQDKPGIPLREALGEFKHHYSSVKSAVAHLPQWIEAGKVPGLRLERVDGRPCLFFDPGPISAPKALPKPLPEKP